MERLLYTVPEVAELLGISKSHAYNLISRGDLPVIRLGTVLRVPADRLTESLKMAQVGPPIDRNMTTRGHHGSEDRDDA